MTKHWKTTVQEAGSDVNLYVSTTDESIRRDLDAGDSGSLISHMRWEKRRESTSEVTDHADLAAGALSLFRDSKGFTQQDSTIHEVDSIPTGLSGSHLGGNSKKGYTEIAVTVYSEKQ